MLKISSTTKLYGVMGHPVRHSLSPKLHTRVFETLGLDGVYLAFDIDKGMLPLAFEAIRSLDIRGINLTIPHKEDACSLVDEIPEDIDRAIGAVNTLCNRDGMLYGYNTDVPGLITSLKEDLSFNCTAKKILLLGAGGAARAAMFAMGITAADSVFVLNRTHDRAVGLCEHVSNHFSDLDAVALEDIRLIKGEKLDLVINATSVGLTQSTTLPIDLKKIGGNPCVLDMVYSPEETAFVRHARELGLSASDGKGMLAAQAALAFGLWTGRQEGVRTLMMEVLGEC